MLLRRKFWVPFKCLSLKLSPFGNIESGSNAADESDLHLRKRTLLITWIKSFVESRFSKWRIIVIDWPNHGIGWSFIRSVKSAIWVCRSWWIGQLFLCAGSLLEQMIPWPENWDQCLLLFDQKSLSIFLNPISGKSWIIVIDWLNHGIGCRSTCIFWASLLVKSRANFLQLVGRASLSATPRSDLFWLKSCQKSFALSRILSFKSMDKQLRITREVVLYSGLIIGKCVCLARFSYSE
jgi:hypothetical protein